MCQESCGSFVHCEYDEGYIVFNGLSNYKEVWRRRIDVLDIPEEAWPSGPHNKPHENMIEASLTAEDQYLDADRGRDPDHLRGQFVPWARLLGPENGRMFKLTRGTLLVSSAETAFLYDVEKAELQQTIELRSSNLGRLQYVDVSERHVFVVGILRLNVYDRTNGSNVLTIDAGRFPWNFYASPENQWRCLEETFNYGELGFRRTAPSNWAHREDYFNAGVWSRILSTVVVPIWLTPPCQVHVSSCGKHLAIMGMSSRIILVQDFWRLFAPSSTKLHHISKQIDFYSDRPTLEPQGYLAYDRGKVAIVCTYGIYVLVLDSILDRLGEIDPPPKDVSLRGLPPTPSGHKPSWPNLRLCEVEFDGLRILNTDMISCLQLTETRLYLSVLSDDIMDERGGNMWCYDFASSPSFTYVP